MTTNRAPSGDAEWDVRFRLIAEAIGRDYRASVNRIAEGRDRPDPFEVLVSTIISLRTRDEVTFAASERLLRRAPDPSALHELPEEEIEGLIYPAGFYRTKARNLRAIATILIDRFDGAVPDTLESLTSLPGVAASEFALMEILPERLWIPVNELLVGFGQKLCTPQSPWCSRCPLSTECRQVGVVRKR